MEDNLIQYKLETYVSKSNIDNAFNRFGTIGRAEHGNFVTSYIEDMELCFDVMGNPKIGKDIAIIKGVPEST